MSISSVAKCSSAKANSVEKPDRPPIVGSERKLYTIINEKKSETTRILFAQEQDSPPKEVVIKLLRQYKDTRFSLLTLHERQQCQLEALQKNPYFSPDIYYGLAPVLAEFSGEEHKMYLGGVGSTLEELKQVLAELPPDDYEYALVMAVLPKERRLDQLLKGENDKERKVLIERLIERVVQLHESLDSADGYDQNGWIWGSIVQIEQKLRHNIALFNLLADVEGGELYRNYCWLGTVLLKALRKPQLKEAFEWRMDHHYIKNCHGDLKASNIWIIDKSTIQADPLKGVRILDAIDFNPAYHNIDVLSDLAMLAVDIAANAGAPIPADFVIRRYVEYAKIDYEQIKYLLAYYLAEKAMVRAAVSLKYDHCPYDIGKNFLSIAKRYADVLQELF